MTLKITGVNANDDLIVSEAIAFAIEGMSRLPSAYRPTGKIVDLKNILSAMPQAERKLLEADARSRIDALLGVSSNQPRYRG